MIMPTYEIWLLLAKQSIPFVGGLVVTGILGLAVDKIVRATRKRWEDTAPPGIVEDDWHKAIKMSESALAPIRWLGWIWKGN